MTELNLLPDVKLEYIRSQRSRRTITSISVLVTGVAVVLLVLLLGVMGVQKKHINDLSDNIKSNSNKLKSQDQIERVLTVQNQSKQLTTLHSQKPAAARLFTYLNQVTPAPVNINNFEIDFTQSLITITGTADSLSNVNKYIDTLKFTSYGTKDSTEATKAFNNVVLTAFGVNSAGPAPDAVSYTVTLNYEAALFDITQDVTLSVPSRTTTRSSVANPTDLFQSPPETTKATGART
jgi:Tfp pilus assembly protein PilN